MDDIERLEGLIYRLEAVIVLLMLMLKRDGNLTADDYETLVQAKMADIKKFL